MNPCRQCTGPLVKGYTCSQCGVVICGKCFADITNLLIPVLMCKDSIDCYRPVPEIYEKLVERFMGVEEYMLAVEAIPPLNMLRGYPLTNEALHYLSNKVWITEIACSDGIAGHAVDIMSRVNCYVEDYIKMTENIYQEILLTASGWTVFTACSVNAVSTHHPYIRFRTDARDIILVGPGRRAGHEPFIVEEKWGMGRFQCAVTGTLTS